MSEVVLALYDSVEQAHRAVDDLVSSGFNRSDIGLAVSDPNKRYAGDGEYADVVYEDEDVSGSEGAGFGATVGGLTGLVAGLVAITIPGVGPIIAAGPLAAVMGGAAGAAIGAVTGAVTGGITASLIHVGVPEHEAEYYTEAVRRGNALVTVTANDADLVRASEILRRHNSIDIERRATQWRKHGWQGFDPKADPFTAEELAQQRELYQNRYDDTDTEPVTRRYKYPQN